MDPSTDPDKIWTNLQQGDQQAFAAIYDLYGPRVFNHCYRRVLSRPDAEDLTSEVFTLAWCRRADIRLVESVGGLPWLLVTANHLMRRQRVSIVRSRQLLEKLPIAEPAPDHAVAIAEAAHDQYALAIIATVLGKLSRRDRDVLQLCVLEGLSPTEVATASGEPASSIRSRLSRALVRARREYSIVTAAAGAMQTGRMAE